MQMAENSKRPVFKSSTDQSLVVTLSKASHFSGSLLPGTLHRENATYLGLPDLAKQTKIPTSLAGAQFNLNFR